MSSNPDANLSSPYRALLHGDYILPPGIKEKRSRFDTSFINIGTATVLGGGLGSISGLYEGFMATRSQKLAPSVLRTQLLNFTVKNSASTSQKFGLLSTFIIKST
ncbi:MAG: mitochondrial import inner membrane translocase, subunit timm23 [Paramarteilia canceri]